MVVAIPQGELTNLQFPQLSLHCLQSHREVLLNEPTVVQGMYTYTGISMLTSTG